MTTAASTAPRRLAFFGTPEFAVPALEGVIEHCRRTGDELVLVVCQPDKPRGRGKKLQPPPVKARAEIIGVRVEQPPTLKQGTPSGDEFWELLSTLSLSLGVVCAYGRIIPGRMLRAPARGCVNVHGSLLPRWRGAAPVQRAIEAGDVETGVGLMDMVYALDEGDVYVEERLPIAVDDDSATLGEKLSALGGRMLVEHLPAILDGTLSTTPQAAEGATYAEMLRKDEATIRWDRPAVAVRDHARAMVPWPGAQSLLDGEVLKLFRPRLVDDDRAPHAAPGEVISSESELVVACGQGAVAFADGQLPGKKRMSIADLTRGRPLPPGTVLGS